MDMQGMGMQGMDMTQMVDIQSRMMGDSAIWRHMTGDSAMREIMHEMGGDEMPMNSGMMGGMDAAGQQRMNTRLRERMNAMTPERQQAMMARLHEAQLRMMADPEVRARMTADPDMQRMMQQMMNRGMPETARPPER